jgi:hypothetical protein
MIVSFILIIGCSNTNDIYIDNTDNNVIKPKPKDIQQTTAKQPTIQIQETTKIVEISKQTNEDNVIKTEDKDKNIQPQHTKQDRVIVDTIEDSNDNMKIDAKVDSNETNTTIVSNIDNNETNTTAIVDNNETNATVVVDNSIKIAVLYPSKTLGKYSQDMINSIISYMLFTNKDFKIKTYDTIDLKPNNVIQKLDTIYQDNFTNIIALIDKDVLSEVISYENINKLKIYLPLVKSFEPHKSLIYGSISYEKQIAKLYTLLEYDNVGVFIDRGYLSQKLKGIIEKYKPKFIRDMVGLYSNYKRYFRRYRRSFKNKYIFLNASLVNNSIMLSQLRANDIKIKQVFSSQVSYSPLILTLTQKKDRKNLIIANSIGKSDDRLIAYSELLNSDIVYNWVNYSSLVGLDYFITGNKSGLVSDRVDNNQVDFNIELMRANGSKFELYIP